MKIVRFTANRKTRYGILKGKFIQEIKGRPFRKITPGEQHYPLDKVKILAPCQPSKIVALGVNYRSHADEVSSDVPESPLLFLKPATAVIGPEDNILYPPSSNRVDYEAELGVVIKKTAWKIAAKDAPDYILGYTCFNDVTARDLQKRDGQWTRAKGFNTFAAIGPWIETNLDPSGLDLETHLNGAVKQKGNTRDLVFTVPQLIDFISHIMTLLPGDVIATGTPGGIGPMNPGDTVEIVIPAIGILRNYIVKDEK